MATVTSQQLLQAIAQSGLIEPAELASAIDAFRATRKGQPPGHARAFSEFLVASKRLTPWQQQRILAGKTDGFQMGKYRLLTPIGRGGMGSVFLAVHRDMGRQVALKVLPPEFASDPSYLERFRREARVVAALDHPHIVRAYDFDQAGSRHFFVMEFVEGPNLSKLVKQRDRPLPVADVVQWTIQAADALQHAHEHQIVHRDVKPSNLLISPTSGVKLLDLGLARWVAGDSSSLTIADEVRVLGTVDYLAPEQATDSHAVDARADIYSLGCTLFFALTGRSPFPEGTIAQRIAQHQCAAPPDLGTLRPDVPDTLEAIYRRMLAKDPAERFPSARDVAKALANSRSAVADAGTLPKETVAGPADIDEPSLARLARDDASSASMLSRVRRATRNRRPPAAIWLVILVLLVIALALGWLVHRRSGSAASPRAAPISRQ